ncbi:MAG: heavy metal translocating P-type ATPase [Solirubrobacterales bacterium]
MERIDLTPELTRGVFQVEGLECPDCAAKLEKAIRGLPGMYEAAITFPLGRLDITYDPDELPLAKVIAQAAALGYQVNSGQTAAPIGVRLEGLDCADCAAKLERSISRLSSVQSVSVNFTSGRMELVHEGPLDPILEVIAKLGYAGYPEDESGRFSIPAKSFWRTNRYAQSAILSGVLLLAAFAAMAVLPAVPIAPRVLFIAAILLGGYLPARSGITVLFAARELDMNILMSIAAIGAVAIGQYEEGGVVVFLFALGNALQAYTMDKTRRSIRSLMELAPDEAAVLRGGSEVRMPISQLVIGDIVVVRPGERIPMDGQIEKGGSAVNQAPITGESMPVDKEAGDDVFAGTVNGNGALEVRVTRLAKDNTIARILKLVEEAQAQKAPSQLFIDRFARYYTPAVIAVAVLVAAFPTLVFHQPFEKWFYEALAMLLVACPCALVISTPVSIVSAIGSAARAGVLIKGGAYLEEIGRVRVIALDKTGTLTTGKPVVTDILSVTKDWESKDILALAAALEARSEHPLAHAFLARAQHEGIKLPALESFAAEPGRGVIGIVGGINYRLGSLRMMREAGYPPAEAEAMALPLEQSGKTVMFLAGPGGLIGVIAAADLPRPESAAAVRSLHQTGIRRVVMLTGDNAATAQAIAESTGTDSVLSGLLPEEKVLAVRELSSEFGKVAMVGDGVNDAPALATACVGIAMGAAGTDAALETADIALMADDLSKLAGTVRLGRRTVGIIKQNIAFSLIVKGLILLLVIPGWLTLWLAVVGDMGSSLLVTLNGMRLLRAMQDPSKIV